LLYNFSDYTMPWKEPAAYKLHWDFLLQEMEWMAIDFKEEFKLKRSLAY